MVRPHRHPGPLRYSQRTPTAQEPMWTRGRTKGTNHGTQVFHERALPGRTGVGDLAVNRAAVQAAARSRESRGQLACHTRRARPPRYWRSCAYEARTVPLSSSFQTHSQSWIRVPQCAQTGYGWLITSPDCRGGGRDRGGAFLPSEQTLLGHRCAGMAKNGCSSTPTTGRCSTLHAVCQRGCRDGQIASA